MEQRLKKPEVAASFYHEAALCFQKDDPQGNRKLHKEQPRPSLGRATTAGTTARVRMLVRQGIGLIVGKQSEFMAVKPS